jgi:hypothetical protein
VVVPIPTLPLLVIIILSEPQFLLLNVRLDCHDVAELYIELYWLSDALNARNELPPRTCTLEYHTISQSLLIYQLARIFPTTSSFSAGVVVPIPIFPET